MSLRNNLKIIVVGGSKTGKTSFAKKWAKDTFDENYNPTLLCQCFVKEIEINRKSYSIHLWDFTGQYQYIGTTKTILKDSHGCIVMSDVTKVGTREK